MKIGCGEWGFRDLPMEDHFRLARKLGFRTLEFGIGGGNAGRLSAEPSDGEIAAFRTLVRDYGVKTPGCCLENDFTLPDESAHKSMLRVTLHQIIAAAKCGAEKVRLFAGFTPVGKMTPPIWSQMFAAFEEADLLCGKLGLSISIETHGRIEFRDGVAHHEHTVTTDPAALSRLLRELPTRIGINYDPGNLKAVAPKDREFALPILNDRINYCHLKDWKRKGDGWEACAIGDDDLDYAPLLEKMSYDGLFLIEYEPTKDVEDGIQRSLNYLRRVGVQLEPV